MIEIQPSAAPFRDWNFRITEECYRANLHAPVLDERGVVSEEINTYEHMSFNFGPTLMRWFARYAPDVLMGLRDADRASQKAHGGAGNAMAQAYHHSILPLASLEDKRTEVKWGIADFQFRFGRMPEGMWLAETAVDLESLSVLEAEGIAFVVLAPRQARRVREWAGGDWDEVAGESVDSSRPYRVSLPNGKSITVFFYGPEASQGIAFGGWLHDGKLMAEQLMGLGEGLTHLATDGESYGHHHKRGEMALAYCIKHLRDEYGVSLTNYAAILEEAAPVWEAEIHENSSWSCSHGVGRWSSNCGCVMDGAMEGKQEWRRVLREALNWLRDELDAYCLREAGLSRESLWHEREGYIHRLHEWETEGGHAPRTPMERVMEIQRHRLMMFTSCGWFFDDPSGLETVQVLRYASRAMELCGSSREQGLKEAFVRRLSPMMSVDPKTPGGKEIFLKRCQATADKS